MGKYFGTDGFRGEANKNLTFEHAVKIGRFLGWYFGENMGKKAKIVIGKDTRRSSYMLEYALCTGLMASGADAYIMHVTTTPSVAYITRIDDFDCGIMISASHCSRSRTISTTSLRSRLLSAGISAEPLTMFPAATATSATLFP